MAKKKSKHYPVVKGSPILSGAAANTLVDSARNLSVLNRRLYRFGRYYEMKVDVKPHYAGAPFEVYVLRDDWAVQKAFQMAYQQYLDVTADERERMSPDQIARWEDFRVEHGLSISINSAVPVLLSPSGGPTTLSGGEFQDSTTIDAAGTRRTFTWGSPSATQWGILQEYDKYANAPTSPTDTVGSSGQRMPYSGLIEDADDTQSLDMQTKGDNPPYDRTGVNATSPWVRVGVLGVNAVGSQKLSTGFFTAPCGLILLKGYSDAGGDYDVTITAKAGDYKGVHAPSMLEIATVNRKRKVVK